MCAMEAKEIIIRLIDQGKITGKEAAILFEAINKPIYYWPYYKSDYKIDIPYEDSKTNGIPWWQNYQLVANKDPEGYSLLSNTGLCNTKPIKTTCDK